MFKSKSRVVSTMTAIALTSVAVLSRTHAGPPANRGGPPSGGPDGGGLPADYFFGLPHHAMGGATLSSDPAGNLAIDNLGSSGQDGVSIDLSVASPPGGVTPGWIGDVDFGPAGGLAAGRIIRVTVRDQFGNAFASMPIQEFGGGHASLSFQQTVCAPCPITVEMCLNGAVVQSMQFAPPYPPVLVTGNIGSQGSDGVQFVVERKRVFTNNFDLDLCTRLPAVQLLQMTGGLPPVDANEVRISLNGLPPGTRYIGNMVISSNGGPITVHGEALLAHELTHTVQQSAHMIGGGDLNGDGRPDLVVSNIGSSGQDGVSLKRFGIGGESAPEPPLRAISAECAWGAMGNLSDGSTMRFTVGNDAPVPEFYTMLITGMASGAGAVSLERCAPCCPCSVTVQAIHNGQLVDQVEHAAPGGATLAVQNIGSQGSENGTLNAYRQYIVKADGLIYDSLVLEVDNPASSSTTLTNSLVGPVTADRVRIRITPTDGTVGEMHHATLCASNVVSFTLFDSSSDPADVDVMVAQGLPAHALGEATLSLTPDGSLLVEGLDPVDPDDDDDGVSMDFDAAQGGGVTIGFDTGMPNTGQMTLSYGAKAGKTGKTKFFDDDGDGDEEMRFSQNICPTCPITVDLLLDGQVVSSGVYPPPYPDALVENPLASSPGGVTHHFVWNSAADLPSSSHGAQLRVSSSAPTLMTLSGHPVVDADCVRISLNGLPPGIPVDDLSSIEITAAGMSSLTVSGITPLLDDQPVAQSGTAELLPRLRIGSVPSRVIRVTNIGSSGQDGVSFYGIDDDDDGDVVSDLDEEIDASVQPITPSGGQTYTVTGRFSDGPLDARVLVSGGGGGGGAGGTNINWDFVGSSTLTHHAQVVLGGVVVLEASNVSGPLVASVDGPVTITGTMCSRVLDGPSLVWSPRSNIRFQSPVTIVLSTGLGAMGDELRIIGENPTTPITGLQSMTLGGSNLADGDLTLMELASVPVNTCPADVDSGGDGEVNINDLLLVINSWGTCPQPCPPTCAADVDPDCAVNINDLLEVINNWGPCE